MSMSQELTRWVSSYRPWKCGILLLIIVALFGQLGTVQKIRNCDGDADGVVDKKLRVPKWTTAVTTNSIAPGELPGYTGWARPEHTLARFFSLESVSTRVTTTMAGTEAYEYVLTVNCEGHQDCLSSTASSHQETTSKKGHGTDETGGGGEGASWFFLRAYGPAVVPGTVTSRSCSAGGSSNFHCQYEISFVFFDSGLYTMEVVLTLSNPPPISAFPLNKEFHREQPETYYEGYLLPGFPLTATVGFEEEGETNPPKPKSPSTTSSNNSNEKVLCEFKDLVETSPTSAMEKARWKVTGKVNEKEYSSPTMNSSVVSTLGYMNGVNSLGIQMDYRYVNDCLLLPESSLDKSLRRDDNRAPLAPECSSGSQDKVHIVYVGDSVLRVQKDMLQQFLKGVPSRQVEFTFLTLHGGYRKNQVLGPTSVADFFRDLKTSLEIANMHNKVEHVVILFNTGLHDIHRLCGAEFQEERPTYLDKDRLRSGSFACVEEYRALLKDFLEIINEFPAALKVFQSTTAAWPKYGNYGIDWNQNGQDMVLISDFCAAFNEIAFEVLEDYKDSGIVVMDGYWITYPRPDNREVGDIGKKLSHPGVEVLSVMTRKWVMLILDRVCLPI